MEFSSFQNRLETEESGSGDIDGETEILRVSIYWCLFLISMIKSFTSPTSRKSIFIDSDTNS